VIGQPGDDDAAERFYRVVLADVSGTATDEESDMLRADLDSAQEWRAVLVRILQDTEAALTRIRADVQRKHTDCFKRGSRGKQEYHDYAAAKERERAGLVKQKAAVVEALKEAKSVFVSLHEEKETRDGGQWNRIEKKVDALTVKLDALLAKMDMRP